MNIIHVLVFEPLWKKFLISLSSVLHESVRLSGKRRLISERVKRVLRGISVGRLIHLARAANVLVALMLLSLVLPTSFDMAEQATLTPDDRFTTGRSSADLTVDYLSASWTTADAGDRKSISTRIKNIGSSSASSFKWGLYLSTDTTITTSDILLDDYSRSSLSSGSTYTSTKYVDIPTSITGGYYYVGMIVDTQNRISESNENNNDDYDTGRVHVYEQPDLIGTRCSGPSSGTVGKSLSSSISVKIENDVSSSHGMNSGSFDWAIYLSTDSTITTSDTQLGSDQYASSITRGSTRTDSLSTSTKFPSSMNAGTYEMGMIIDVDEDVDEADETNNVYSCGQITLQEDLADLEAYSVSTMSSSAAMGDTITVSYRVNNLGTDNSGSFKWELYLSTDSTITTSDTLVDEFSLSSITAGSYRSGHENNVAIPTGISSGYYYLGMIADSRDDVSELDETNNIDASSSRIRIDEPAELVPSIPSGPSTALAGQQVSISWRIDNDGDVSSGSFKWEMYLSTDSTITTSDTKLGSTQQTSSISGGSYRTGTYSPTLPSTLQKGTYYFGIIVDTSDQVAESDETNNILLGNSVVVTVPDYDLEATSILIDATKRQVCEGGSTSVTLTVTNLGQDLAPSHYVEILLVLSTTSSGIAQGSSLYLGQGQTTAQSYSTLHTFSVPTTALPGSYHLVLIVDVYDQVGETDENNNLVFTSSNAGLQILDCRPDLTAISISGPTAGSPGQAVDIDLVLANVGWVDASSVSVEILLTTDTSIDSVDAVVATTTISISARNTWSDVVRLSIPSNQVEGCWYWAVRIDPTDRFDELREDNNTLLSSTTFCIAPADLSVVSVSQPVGDAVSGSFIEVVIELENIGGSDAGLFEVTLTLSSDDVVDGTDHAFPSLVVSELEAGGAWMIRSTVTLPTGIIGEHRWIVVVDTMDQVLEKDETNNQGMSAPFSIETRSIDLQAIIISAQSSADPGQTIDVDWSVANLGLDPLSFDVEILLSVDAVPDASDQLLYRQRVILLDHAGSYHEKSRVTLPGDVVGEYWFVLSVDNTQEHDEEDESNNLVVSDGSIMIDIDAPPPITSDLRGCEVRDTDGESGKDAPSTRFSALELGLDPDVLLEGCLADSDHVDWFTFSLSPGNRSSIALWVEGGRSSSILYQGDVVLDQAVFGEDDWLAIIATQNHPENADVIVCHLQIWRDVSESESSYRLHVVTSGLDETVDITPPSIPEPFDIEGWVVNDTAELWFKDGDSDTSYHEVRWAGGDWFQIEGTPSLLDVSALDDGKHSLEIRSVDEAGNTGPMTAIWIRIDRTAPAITSNLSYVSGGTSDWEGLLDVDVEDGNGSGHLLTEWSSDGSIWASVPVNNHLILPIDATQIWVRVTDSAGWSTITIVETPETENVSSSPSPLSFAGDTESGSGLNLIVLIVGLISLLFFPAAVIGIVILNRRGTHVDDDDMEDAPPALPSHLHATAEPAEQHSSD
ncbi:MAG: hypothetical protein CL992_02730, partial [Euryarchaeota archaeon]|nr:hypothetical protein [Euryarchaeota archaeon]